LRVLLDTHALLWWLADDERLGLDSRALIEDSRTEVLVSVVSLWEIVVKVRIGKLEADIAEIWEAILREGFTPLEIAAAHLIGLANLPLHHRDPFDHLLLAQAIFEEAVFISNDRHAPRYGARVRACSDDASEIAG
jgi:PIN domain nuclease of toxin-antitoxin system